VDRHSAVNVATRYVLDGPGFKSRWGRDFLHPSRPALESTQPPTQWLPSLSRELGRRGIALPTPSSAEVKGRVELYIYSPSGSSWPVLGWPLPLFYRYLLFPVTLKYVLQHSILGPHQPVNLKEILRHHRGALCRMILPEVSSCRVLNIYRRFWLAFLLHIVCVALPEDYCKLKMGALVSFSTSTDLSHTKRHGKRKDLNLSRILCSL
jgi:hypothetical protein